MSLEKPNQIESLNPEKVRDLQEKIYKMMESDNFEVYMDEVADFSESLSKKYGNEIVNYELYHVLAGSSMMSNPTMFDFEGQDSIEDFIETSYKKYITKED